MTGLRIWALPADDGAEIVHRCRAVLSPAERDFVGRLARPADRRRAVVGRGGARILLGRLLDRDPAALRIDRTEAGKPVLSAVDDRPPGLQFNVSHSGNLVLIAVAWGAEVGVDLERLPRDPVGAQIAAVALTPAERRLVARAAPAARDRLVLQCWTRKEALLKACGTGLSTPPDSFGVLRGVRGGPAAGMAGFADFADFADEVAGFSVRPLDAGPGFVAAVAIRGAAPAGPPIVHWPAPAQLCGPSTQFSRRSGTPRSADR